MKAKAVVVTAVNEVEVRSVDLPDPGPGQVLVETLYSCISPGTELRCLSGKQGDSDFPFIPGYASVGQVSRVGTGASIKEGTITFFMGTEKVNGVNSMWGSHMSHAVCSADRLLPVPQGLDLVQASAAKMASIPYHGLRLCHPLPEEKIAIIGLGPIGHMAAKLYTMAGSHAVGCDMSAKRVAQAKSAGINAVVVSGTLKETFAPLFPDGADVVVDATGSPRVMAGAIDVCREFPWGNHHMRGPRYVVQGSYAEGFTVPYNSAFLREMSFILPRSEQDRDRSIVYDMLGRGVISLKSVISDVRKPDDAPATYAQLRAPDTDLMTVVFKWK
jgi:bacteriochlorophyllide a dehydrogenase